MLWNVSFCFSLHDMNFDPRRCQKSESQPHQQMANLRSFALFLQNQSPFYASNMFQMCDLVAHGFPGGVSSSRHHTPCHESDRNGALSVPSEISTRRSRKLWISQDKSGMLTKEDGDIIFVFALKCGWPGQWFQFWRCGRTWSSKNDKIWSTIPWVFNGFKVFTSEDSVRSFASQKCQVVPRCLVLGALLGVRIISPINPPSSCVLHIIHLPHLPERLVSGEQTKRESHV